MSTKAFELIKRSAARINLVRQGPVHARGQACERLIAVEQEMYTALDRGWDWLEKNGGSESDDVRWNDLRRQYERTVDARTGYCTAPASSGDVP